MWKAKHAAKRKLSASLSPADMHAEFQLVDAKLEPRANWVATAEGLEPRGVVLSYCRSPIDVAVAEHYTSPRPALCRALALCC